MMSCRKTFTILVYLWAASVVWGGGRTPRIIADPPTISFGQRDAGEIVTNRFTLRNTGRAELTLKRAVSSCGCIRTALKDRSVAPGQQTTLDVHLALRGLRGQQRKSVSVMSNDPITPVLNLWMEGEVRQAVCFEPASVTFGNILPDSPAPPVVVRLAGYMTNVTVTAVASNTPAFPVAISADGRSLTFDSPKLTAPGSYHARVEVSFSDPAYSPQILHVYAWRDAPLRVTPARITFRAADDPAVIAQRLVIVRPGTASRCTVLAARLEGVEGKTEIQPRPDGSHIIRLHNVRPATLTPGAALVIATDLADTPEWRVPIHPESADKK